MSLPISAPPAALAEMLVGQLGPVAPSLPSTMRPRTFLLDTYIAGMYHRGFYPQCFDTEFEGATLRLEREPANEYDELAIRVYADQTWVGYIPRPFNQVLARMLDAGIRISVEEDELIPPCTEDAFKRGLSVGIRLYLEPC